MSFELKDISLAGSVDDIIEKIDMDEIKNQIREYLRKKRITLKVNMEFDVQLNDDA
jgi:hypothetical protein